MFNKEKKADLNFLSSQPTGILVFENGLSISAIGIGHEGHSVGEVCFNTSMTGYQEIITDPSYSDQIINFTFPHIGNVGANFEDIESEKVWLKGVIFAKEITEPSNYRSFEKLNDWLKKNEVVGIAGVDTRAITNLIRNKGALKATIVNGGTNETNKYLEECKSWPGLEGMELTKKVTTQQIYNWNDEGLWSKEKGYNKNDEHKYHVVVLDFGCKKNILRNFSNLKTKLTVVPADTNFNKISELKPDGVFLSNGPGDPAATSKFANETIKKILESNIPTFGICLGHQLLAHALNCKTKKMHQGHRGANHPVKNLNNNLVEITSQNHGFEVDKDNIPNDVEVTHISLFDQSIEGIKSKKYKAFSVQYHPEASPGPHDSHYLFLEFIKEVEKNAKKN
ncbi:glutamine-hydrolyzing carbamoyl-phosphate synthase small subunit [Candidatus Pelagibacter sp. HIMB1517]|uniref:glutamine-hydrolyzing carbamoyl-phosphate synthase small subunit n=1 Tax=Candidatus Pelagibacter sp. HIMB1517 TaxID=3413341 RepID=UPI003F82D192